MGLPGWRMIAGRSSPETLGTFRDTDQCTFIPAEIFAANLFSFSRCRIAAVYTVFKVSD